LTVNWKIGKDMAIDYLDRTQDHKHEEVSNSRRIRRFGQDQHQGFIGTWGTLFEVETWGMMNSAV
jgi:hypothetical protein